MDALATTFPLFTVVIPSYNRADTILPTLNSVKQQIFSDYECIVVDDGSDDSHELQKVINELKDSRFRYVYRENGGGGAARNTGIDEARGKYIAFLDSDDFFVPHKLSTFASLINHDPLQAYYSRVNVNRGSGRYWARPDRAIGQTENMGDYLFVFNQFIQTSSIVIATETVRRVRFDPALRKGQDLDLCIRLDSAGVRFQMIEEPLTIWTDISEANRTSRHAGYEAPLQWLDKSEALLSKRSIAGYRATVLAYYLAHDKPFTATRDLVLGLTVGVPPKVIARQFLRCFVPRHQYRKIVNLFVSLRGTMGA